LREGLDTQPVVDSLTSTATTMVFTGKNFPTSGYASSTTTFAGVAADTVVVDSATQITATWTTGTPVSESEDIA